MTQITPTQVRCGWRGCAAACGVHTLAEGWATVIVHDDPKPVLDLTLISRWRHDKVLCPQHALILDQLLDVGTGSASR